MQIHELNTFAGTPGDNNFLAIDNGSDTGKISGTNLLKPVNDRITNLANSVTPDSAEVILDTPGGASPGPATLSKSVANFDYLEFYFAQIDGANINNAGYLRVPVSYNAVDVSIPAKDGTGLWVQELKLSWSGTSLTISNIKLWEWDGAANSAATSQSNVWVTDVVRVVGIKTSSNTPAELADIRVGANGITYPSAGDAVRGQYTELNNHLNGLVTGVAYEYLNNVALFYGYWAANDNINTPHTNTTRLAYTALIPIDVFDSSTFDFQSNGAYKIAFVGFDEDGKCNAVPTAWLSDGSYTKQAIIANANITNSPYVSFQMRNASDTVISPTVVNSTDYCSLLYQPAISVNAIKDGSITESKLDQDLNEKINLAEILVDGTPVEYLTHVLLSNGSFATGNTIDNPTGGGNTARRYYKRLIPFDVLDDTVFKFASSGAYNIAFVAFDEDGICDGTPIAWLNDGTYTKAQVLSNSRATQNSKYFTYQIKNIAGTTISVDIYADDYFSVLKHVEISPYSIAADSIDETKLSPEVRDKLNGTNIAKTVDVIMFMGQSNMAGRGEVANAPSLIPGAGYEYRAISDPNDLVPMVEPFGATESNPSGINEGAAKTGSMVVAFTNAYYTHNGNVPVVGISASKGGTPISDWQPGGAYLNDAISRLTSCVTYLEANNYTIRHKYILWCQGETDGDNNTTAQDYKTLFDAMLTEMMSKGIEKLFMVRIGNLNYQSSTKYDVIMNCQTDIAQTETDVVMASTDFAGMRARGLMKDQFHYYQAAYNEVGTYSGINVALYEQTGKEPTMYDTKDGTLYYTHKN